MFCSVEFEPLFNVLKQKHLIIFKKMCLLRSAWKISLLNQNEIASLINKNEYRY